MMDGDEPDPAYPADITDALELVAQSPAGEIVDPAKWEDREMNEVEIEVNV